MPVHASYQKGIPVSSAVVRSLRQKLCLSQAEMADKLGVSAQTVKRFEQGVIVRMVPRTFRALAELAGVSLDELRAA